MLVFVVCKAAISYANKSSITEYSDLGQSYIFCFFSKSNFDMIFDRALILLGVHSQAVYYKSLRAATKGYN